MVVVLHIYISLPTAPHISTTCIVLSSGNRFVEDPCSLIDEASLGDGVLGDGDVRDHAHSVRGFLRWSGENCVSLTLKSDYDLGRGACSWNLGFERNAHCFHVARLDSAPHSGVSCHRCTS